MSQPTEKQIIDAYTKLTQELQMIQQKLFDLENKFQEHELVIAALKPLESERKCFRLMGGVLVERTVGQVLPVLETNVAQLKKAVEAHSELLDRKKKDLAAFQTKWKIRLKGAPEGNALEQAAGSQGVLVE